MKKNFLMVSIIATLLVSVLVLINKTHAAIAQLQLSVISGTISNCTAATGINLGSIAASNGTTTLSGTTWVGPNFGCTDTQGNAAWNYTMVAVALTGTNGGSIAASNITLAPLGAVTTTPVGACTSVNTGAGGTLDSAKNLISKTNGLGQTCTFNLPSAQAKLTVSIPAFTPVGVYTSTLTIVYPS